MTRSKPIEYKITYAEGPHEIVRVTAATIDSGFPKAYALRDRLRELHSIQFWQVMS